MRFLLLGFLAASAALAGCATPDAALPTDNAHPAYADAPTLPLPSTSGTLAVDSQRSDAPPRRGPSGHEAHQHGTTAAASQPDSDQRHQHGSAPEAPEFTCPMHLEIQSDTPGRCPKCNMELVPKKPSEGQP